MENNRYTISETDYFEMSRFVEKLYLEEFDLLILMARKFYSLFLLFQKLNTEKLNQLGVKYSDLLEEDKEGKKYKRKIINNNAIDLLENDIRDGKYKKIIIADDIIIHGRSVRSLYDKLLGWNEELDISIRSLIRNDDDNRYYADIKDHLISEYVVESDVWKGISSNIVEIFYISGRPYISYLPYFTLEMGWDELCSRLELDQCHEINNELMEKFSVKGLLYTGSAIERFAKFPGVCISALRLYYYERLNQITVIPYFCMDVIENDSLNAISNNLRKLYLEKEYSDIISANNGAESVRVRELEYVISLWLGMYFSNALGLKKETWYYDSEIYSFCREIVSHETMSNSEIEAKLDQLVENIGEIKKPEDVFINEDLIILHERYIELKEKYKLYADKWETGKKWAESNDFEKRFLEELLSVNGSIDEIRFKNEKNRLLGIPLSFVVKDLGKHFKSLSKDDYSVNWHSGRVFAATMAIVDSGKGTIFNRTVKKSISDGYYESLLHAGEQNFVFYENTNFPALYALYMLEMLVQFKNSEQEAESKAKFMTAYLKYMEDNNYFIIEKELEQLLTLRVKKDYGRRLLEAYYDYQNNPVLVFAVKQALETVEEYRNG